MGAGITRGQVRAYYDALGAKEDWWAIFGDAAVESMIHHGAFGDACAVLELGCGTGRLAARLLRDHLPDGCRYLALDLSPVMVRLAKRRLQRWQERASVVRVDAAPSIPAADESVDRVVATYVVELLDPQDAAAVIREAKRVLRPHGLLCMTSLTTAQTGLSRLVCGLWNRVYAWRPALLGGCRPIAILDCLAAADWTVRHRAVTVRWGVPCEAVVAEVRKSDVGAPVR